LKDKEPGINYIKLEDCKDGYVYFIFARNGHIGIFKKSESTFELSRFKFNENYIYPETHWDADEFFGTVKPIKLIEKAPEFSSEKDKLAYLNNLSKDYEEDCNRLWIDYLNR
jgi:hypothetical protein